MILLLEACKIWSNVNFNATLMFNYLYYVEKARYHTNVSDELIVA